MMKTPLYDTHVDLGAKMTEFAGWIMPVQYTGIINEHNHVRESAGLFDVSHMGEIMLIGKDALNYADYLLTNDLSKIKHGGIVYSPMCYENGGCVDDVLAYCFNNEKILIVVNASNIEKDYEWISKNQEGFDVEVENLSDQYAQIAVQGPEAEKILDPLTDRDLKEMGFFKFYDNVNIGDAGALVSRTGYTGEDGFEIYLNPQKAEYVFRLLMEEGGNRIKACGLGARDTLRLESCLPLYGNELSPEITPIQAGLKHFVKPGDGEYIGKQALKEEYEAGPAGKIAAFEMEDRGIARHGYAVFSENDEEIGFVTSGSPSPTLSKNIGLAFVDTKHAVPGNRILIGIRSKKVKAVIVKKPFYKRNTKKEE